MTSADVRAGLYGLRPWFAPRLGRVRATLAARRVSPGAISAAGIACGAGVGAALAVIRPGWLCGLVVAALLVVRLACANLDGRAVRGRVRPTRFGAVVGELGERVAELAALAGCLAFAPAALIAAAGLATTLPSWVSLAGAAAGAPRIHGGPVGRNERCLLLAVLAAIGAWPILLSAIALGAAVTAAVRVARLRTMLTVP